MKMPRPSFLVAYLCPKAPFLGRVSLSQGPISWSRISVSDGMLSESAFKLWPEEGAWASAGG